jgi:acetate kinase
MDIKEFIMGLEVFGGIGEYEAEALAAASAVEEFEDGQAIIRQGDTCESLWFVAEGAVEVFMDRGEGDRKTVAELGPGEMFGEISVISGERTIAGVVAKGPCTAISLPGNKVSYVLVNNPKALSRITSTFVCRLSDNARMLSEDEL